MHHALQNLESHALKDAAAKHGGIADTDEKDLKKAVTEARKIASSWGWKIANKQNCPLLHKKPNKGWEVMDYWVPRQVALTMWRQSEACKMLVSAIESEYSDERYYENVLSSLQCVSKEYREMIRSLPGWEWHPPEVELSGDHPWHTVAATYCKLDTLRSVVLYRLFKAELLKANLWHQYLEFLISAEMTYRMEDNGLEYNSALGQKELHRYIHATEDAKTATGFALSKLYPFNPASPIQVRSILYGRDSGCFGLPVTRRTVNKKNPDAAGSPTIDKDFLSDVIGFSRPDNAKDLVPPIWHREAESFSTYRDRMDQWHDRLVAASYDDRAKINQLYAFCCSLMMYKKLGINVNQIKAFERRKTSLDSTTGFATLFHELNPWGTNTTRLSGSNPNGQNVSKGGKAKKSVTHLFDTKQTLRILFGPSPGREWWNCDYTQLQLVIFAFMAKDEGLISAVLRGQDFHDIMARTIFGLVVDPDAPGYAERPPTDDERGIAKNVVFGFLFGAQEAKINQTCGMPGLYDILCNKLPNVVAHLDRMEWQVRNKGYVYTMGGYRLYVSEDKPYAGNVYAVQGTEGEIGKRATYGCQDYLDRRVKNRRDLYITLPLHDELDFSATRGFGQYHISNLCQIMEDAAESYGVMAKVKPKLCLESWASGDECSFDEEVPTT
jgi:hypothetical protein